MNLSRRAFVATVGTIAASTLVPARGESDGPYAEIAATDAWIGEWMAAFGAGSGSLHLGRFSDRVYFLLTQIDWSPDPGQHGDPVHVPAGFVTRFASVPRVYWSTLARRREYTHPAIFHDYLYWAQTVEREQADYVFKCAMGDAGIEPASIASIYDKARAGGAAVWNENANRRAAGEKRILRLLPDHTGSKWETWKKGNVF